MEHYFKQKPLQHFSKLCLKMHQISSQRIFISKHFLWWGSMSPDPPEKLLAFGHLGLLSKQFSSSLRGRGSTVLISVTCNLLFSVFATVDVADVVVLLKNDYNNLGKTH